MVFRENVYLQNVKNFLYSEVLLQEQEIRGQGLQILKSQESEEEVLKQRLEVGVWGLVILGGLRFFRNIFVEILVFLYVFGRKLISFGYFTLYD